MKLSMLSRALLRNAGIDFIEEEIQRRKISRCFENSITNNSFFYPEASVINLQANRDKIRLGNNTHVRGKLQIFNQGGEIKVGDYCYIGENSYIWSAALIDIGDRVLIAHGVNIHDNVSHPIEQNQRHDDYKRILGLEMHDPSRFDLKAKKVTIENDVWIGFNSTVLKGVTIGKGSIIGACTLVTKDVPAHSLVVGNPQRLVKKLL